MTNDEEQFWQHIKCKFTENSVFHGIQKCLQNLDP
jgi:hypothetical protein